MKDDSGKNVTIAVGIADKQPAILDYARIEAERAACGITLVHAYSVPAVTMGSAYSAEVPEVFRAAGQDVLDESLRYLTKSGATVPIDSVLTSGNAPSALEDASRTARLMIIGPDDKQPWYLRMFEGRVAHHLVEHAGCPIVVVPDSWSRSHDSAPIVVMVDGEANAYGPLQFAFETASARGVELRVLHVIPPDSHGGDGEWQSVRRVIDAWFDRHPEVSGASSVVNGDVLSTAMHAADGAGMLIVGRPHERRIANALIDSLAQEIIADSGCPVGVVPADYRPSTVRPGISTDD